MINGCILPALKRVKRINSRNTSQVHLWVVNSHLKILSSQEVEKYKYKFLREEACGAGNKWKCHVIERTTCLQIFWLH